MDSFKILVCCHKQTEHIGDPNFPSILLGSEFAPDSLKQIYANDHWDNSGENIGRLHPYCAELTSIYWAWKNYEKLGNPDYIGLFHYRRFFNFGEPLQEPDLWKCAFFDFDQKTRRRFGWDEETIRQFCQGYDLILPHREQILDPHDWQTPTDLETHYKHAHCPEDFDLVMNFIKKIHPEYTDAVEQTRSAGYAHFCNMFVMTRELFFDYAQWLFDIILPLEKMLPVTDPKYNNVAQKRVLGFLGERLFNIWITQQRLKKDVKIRQTQRLVGYLSMEEQAHLAAQYGAAESRRLLAISKTIPRKKDEGALDVGNALLHPSRVEDAPEVSILVPVYNVSPYLRECIESLIHQTLENIEIVFVDNCSTDDSLDILMTYYDYDPRIAVIEHKKNEGLPGSRNTALKYARGKYFSYIDSDDICDLSMFQKLYDKAEALGADIVTCSVTAFIDTLDNQYLHRPLEWYGDSDKLLPLSGRPQQLMEPAAWCKLFRTEYVKNLDYFEFRPGTIAWEDVPAMTSAFIQTDRIATVQEALYFYRQRSAGNLSNHMTKRNTKDFLSGEKLQREILEKHNYHDAAVLSYIEEFKFLYVKWILSKMRKRDIPYLFHKAGGVFKGKNKQYLSRVFQVFPRDKVIYSTLRLRWSFPYLFAKGCRMVARKTKNLLKRLFSVGREGCYRTFKIGPFRCRQFLKKYSNETIAWLEGKYYEAQGTVGWLNSQNAALQGTNAQLSQDKLGLQKDMDILQDNNAQLQKHQKALEQANADLRGFNTRLQTDNDLLKDANTGLESTNAALARTNASLEQSNAALTQSNTALTQTNAALQQSNTALEQTRAELQYRSDRQAEVQQQQGEQIRSLSDTVAAYQKETAGFFRAVWTTGWIRYWKDYYYQNFAQIPARLQALTAGMDKKSVDTVNRLCDRNFRLLPQQEDTPLYLFNHWKLYTPEEQEGAKVPLDEAPFREKFVIAPDAVMETPVFTFHCGLKCLPQDITARLAGKDILDGGAYWGDSALVFTEYSPRHIYAFEPHPATHTSLCRTISANHLEAVITPVEAGLGSTNENAQLYTNGMLSGSSLTNVIPVESSGQTDVNDIRICSIDDFVREHNLDVGLIKLDIEGNELSAIQGAAQTIRSQRPLLSIAVYHNPKDLFEIKPLIEAMDLGYRFIVRKLVYHDLVTEVVLLGYPEN